MKRRLTALEEQEIRRVFAGGIDCSLVRIAEGADWTNAIARWTARLRGGPPPDFDNSVTLGNTIHFPRSIHTTAADLVSPTLGDFPWLLHEAMHVRQHQAEGLPSLFRTLKAHLKFGAAVYDYGGPAGIDQARAQGKGLAGFNPEAQGEIARDFYRRLRKGQDISAWEPLFVEARKSPPKIHR